MHELFFGQQFFFRFTMVFIVNATIYRTNGSALWFVMKSNTLGTFIGNNKVNIHGSGFLCGFGIQRLTLQG
jgi:hypothetical protein